MWLCKESTTGKGRADVLFSYLQDVINTQQLFVHSHIGDVFKTSTNYDAMLYKRHFGFC